MTVAVVDFCQVVLLPRAVETLKHFSLCPQLCCGVLGGVYWFKSPIEEEPA